MDRNKVFLKKILFAGLFFSFLGGLFHYFLVYKDYKLEKISYKTPSGYTINGLLYIPHTEKPPPVIIPFHGVISTKEMLHSFSIEMCRNGYAVLSLDLHKPPMKFFENVDFYDYFQGGLDFLKHRKEVDSSRIALMGHSWGGFIAYSYGTRTPEVKTVISYGMSIYTAPGLSPDILLASGAYDLLHPPEEMLLALGESSGVKDPKTGEIYGNMSEGTGRKLVISYMTDHSSEILDPVLIYETIKWLDLVFSSSERENIIVKEPYRLISENVRNFGIFLCLFYFSYYLMSLFHKRDKFNKFPLFFPPFCFFLIIIFKALSGLLCSFAPDTAFIIVHIMLWTGFLYRYYFKSGVKEVEYIGEKYIYSLKTVLTYFILIWSSVIVSITLLNVPFFIKEGWFLKVPFMFVFKFFTDSFFYFCKTKPYLGLVWTQGWGIFFFALLPLTLLEMFKPGLIINIFSSIIRYIFRKRERKPVKSDKKKSYGLLLVLLFAAIVSWINLITRGISVNMELIFGLLWVMLQYFLFPLILIIIFYKILKRFSWFPKIEFE